MSTRSCAWRLVCFISPEPHQKVQDRNPGEVRRCQGEAPFAVHRLTATGHLQTCRRELRTSSSLKCQTTTAQTPLNRRVISQPGELTSPMPAHRTQFVAYTFGARDRRCADRRGVGVGRDVGAVRDRRASQKCPPGARESCRCPAPKAPSSPAPLSRTRGIISRAGLFAPRRISEAKPSAR
jgi:hypothetical protein